MQNAQSGWSLPLMIHSVWKAKLVFATGAWDLGSVLTDSGESRQDYVGLVVLLRYRLELEKMVIKYLLCFGFTAKIFPLSYAERYTWEVTQKLIITSPTYRAQ